MNGEAGLPNIQRDFRHALFDDPMRFAGKALLPDPPIAMGRCLNADMANSAGAGAQGIEAKRRDPLVGTEIERMNGNAILTRSAQRF